VPSWKCSRPPGSPSLVIALENSIPETRRQLPSRFVVAARKDVPQKNLQNLPIFFGHDLCPPRDTAVHGARNRLRPHIGASNKYFRRDNHQDSLRN
jgi:hypothetical protein